jgi:4-carboxymuconolactone decarboxylase
MRLRGLRPEQLTDAQKALYDRITGGPRAAGPRLFPLADAEGRLAGPFGAMLLTPAIGEALQELGSAVRYRGALPDRSREIAILVVAHHWRSAFEVQAHEAVGRAAGLDDEEIAALRDERHDELPERLVADTAYALAARGDLDDAEYVRAVEAIGEDGLFELSTLVGYYATLALQMRIFRV